MKQIRKTWSFVLVLTLGWPLAATAQSAKPLYDLGELPEGFAVEWPAPPEVEERVDVASAEEFNQAAATPGTKIVVTASIPTTVSISASDIDVRMQPEVSLGGLTLQKGVSRVRVRGGEIGGYGIMMSYPTEYYPAHTTREEWVIRDVLFDQVSVRARADRSALDLRGERVAVINSYLRGGEYAIWSDTSNPLQNQDVIIAGNVLESEGDQATLRLVGVLHAAVVDNRIDELMLTGRKHAFRVHGASDQVYAAHNLLVNGGTMFGTMPGDDIGEMWFDDNVIHHMTEDLFHPGTVAMLHASDNVAYSARKCFLCGQAGSMWEIGENELLPYEPPPSSW